MSRTILHLGLLSPFLLGITAMMGSGAIAETSPTPAENSEFAESQTDQPAQQFAQVSDSNRLNQLNQYTSESQTQSQVTSVNQLSDVQPTDWAFQALQSLVERYGCIAGYPDGTFKGNRALTRYEFAAGLNACLDQVTELLGAATSNLVTREDLALLQRLQEEFAAELASIRGRVLALESRTAELEANQFSTTTKLTGEVIFQIGDTFGDRSLYNVAGGPNTDDSDDPTQAYFGYRARLNFDTSFTGEDLLRTRLEAKDIPNLSDVGLNNSLMTRTGTDGTTDGFELDDLYYRFPLVNGRAQVYVGVKSLDLDDIQDPVTPFQSTGAGAVSRFGRYNPTSFRGPEGTGAAVKYALNDKVQVNMGYLASDEDAPDASEGRGLFNGSHTASAQVLFEPTDRIGIGLEYNRRYFRDGDVNVSGGTGSFIANRPFGENATTSDNLGVQVNWKLLKNFELGGWFGSSWAHQETGGEDEATILNWAVTLAFPDAIREGDLGGVIVGMPPKVVDHDINNLEDRDTSVHLEAFYRFQLNDNVGIIPGFYVVTDPDHNSENDTTWVGTLRTQFRF